MLCLRSAIFQSNRLLEIERELAKQRQLSKLTHVKDKLSLSSNELNEEHGQARDIVAKEVMLSPTTFQRAVTVIEKGSEELKEILEVKYSLDMSEKPLF